MVCAAFAQDPVAKGIEEFHQGKYEAAKATLEQVLKQKPGDAHARAFWPLRERQPADAMRPQRTLRKYSRRPRTSICADLAGLALAQCHLARNRYESGVACRPGPGKRFPATPMSSTRPAKLHMKAWNDVVFQMFPEDTGVIPGEPVSARSSKSRAAMPRPPRNTARRSKKSGRVKSAFPFKARAVDAVACARNTRGSTQRI